MNSQSAHVCILLAKRLNSNLLMATTIDRISEMSRYWGAFRAELQRPSALRGLGRKQPDVGLKGPEAAPSRIRRAAVEGIAESCGPGGSTMSERLKNPVVWEVFACFCGRICGIFGPAPD
jgi:hypothetical protein